MKKILLLVALLALPLAARAQSTNLDFSLTVTEGTTRTNTFVFGLTQLQVAGVFAAYEANLAVTDPTNQVSFRNFARNYSKDLLQLPLAELGRAAQLKQAQVDKIQQSITANWENATPAQRKLLTDWLAAFPVAP